MDDIKDVVIIVKWCGKEYPINDLNEHDTVAVNFVFLTLSCACKIIFIYLYFCFTYLVYCYVLGSSA